MLRQALTFISVWRSNPRTQTEQESRNSSLSSSYFTTKSRGIRTVSAQDERGAARFRTEDCEFAIEDREFEAEDREFEPKIFRDLLVCDKYSTHKQKLSWYLSWVLICTIFIHTKSIKIYVVMAVDEDLTNVSLCLKRRNFRKINLREGKVNSKKITRFLVFDTRHTTHLHRLTFLSTAGHTPLKIMIWNC